MGLFFKSRRRSRGGGLMGLLIIGGALYYTGALPVVWDHLKNAGNACRSVLGGIGGASACGAVDSVMASIDNGVQSMGNGIEGLFSDGADQMDDAWRTSDTRASMVNFTKQMDKMLGAFGGRGNHWASEPSTLDALMKMGPGGFSMPGDELGQLRGAMDAFTIGRQLMGSQPDVGAQWMERGASMGAFGLPSQLSLGNMYAQMGDSHAALAYLNQAHQSLGVLRGSNSPAAQQMLGGMNVSPQQLQAQIIAAIKQIQGGLGR